MSKSLQPGDLVPSQDVWERSEFLSARRAQARQPLELPNWMKGAEVTVVEMGSTILCDGCAAEILEQKILLVQFGRKVMCSPCYQQFYKNEPIEYRRILPNGTLGELQGRMPGDKSGLDPQEE